MHVGIPTPLGVEDEGLPLRCLTSKKTVRGGAAKVGSSRIWRPRVEEVKRRKMVKLFLPLGKAFPLILEEKHKKNKRGRKVLWQGPLQ